MNQVRKFLVVFTMSLSFGGFLFYAGCVIRIGTRVVGATTQGFITKDVTHVLNVATAICLGLLTWEIVAGNPERSRRVTRVLVGLVVAMSACCVALFVLHPFLDELLVEEYLQVTDPSRFYRLHRGYLWASTIQWMLSLPTLWIVLLPRAETDAEVTPFGR